MAGINSNKVYLSINGRVIADPADTNDPKIFVSIDPQPTTEDVDVTGGPGAEWKETGPGLTGEALTITFLCVEQRWAADVAAITNNTGHGTRIPIEYGLFGRDPGQPRHVCNYKVGPPSGPSPAVDKPAYQVVVNAISSGEPSINRYAGATYT